MNNRLLINIYIFILILILHQCGPTLPENAAPVITSLEVIPDSLNINEDCVITCYAIDDEPLIYQWDATFGYFPEGNTHKNVTWRAPDSSGVFSILVTVSDNEISVIDSVQIKVINTMPDPVLEWNFIIQNTNISIGMIKIIPEPFYMGAPGTPGAGDDEAPQHLVNLTIPFWIGEFEVTQEQWQAVMGPKSFTFPGAKNPADNISWYNAKSFVNTLNNLEQDSLWRLPNEAEWEYCSRAGHYNTRFWYGDDLGYSETNNHSWNSTNSNGRTYQVGTTAGGVPNPYGLWDMGGNVWEWCEDWYHWGYVGAPNNGSAWVNPTGNSRIIRGGSFWEDGRRALPNLRSLAPPNGTSPTLGFRLVRDVD